MRMKQRFSEESDGKGSSRMSKVKTPHTPSTEEDPKKIKMELPVNVFCSICNEVFDYVTDLQNHLSDHLHLDKERRIALEELQGISREEAKKYNGLKISMKDENDTGFNEDQETMEIPETYGHSCEEMGEVIEITPELHHLGQSQPERSGGYFTPELESALLAHYSDHFPSLWIALSENRDRDRVNQYYNGNNDVGDQLVAINENIDSIDSAISTERIESASESEEEEEEEIQHRQPALGNFVCPSCSLRFPSLNACSAHLLTGLCLKNCILEEKTTGDPSFMPQITYQCPCCEKQFLNMRSFGTHCYNHILECSKPAGPNNSLGNNKVMQAQTANKAQNSDTSSRGVHPQRVVQSFRGAQPAPQNLLFPRNPPPSQNVQFPRNPPPPQSVQFSRHPPPPQNAQFSRNPPPPQNNIPTSRNPPPPQNNISALSNPPPQQINIPSSHNRPAPQNNISFSRNPPPPQNTQSPHIVPLPQNIPYPQASSAPQNIPFPQGVNPPQNAPAPQHKPLQINAPAPQNKPPPRNTPTPQKMPSPRSAPAPRKVPSPRSAPAPRKPPSPRSKPSPKVKPPRMVPPPRIVTAPPPVPAVPNTAVESAMTDDPVDTTDSPVRVTRKSMRLKLKLHEQRTIVLTPSEVKSAMLKPPLTDPNSFAFKEPDILSCATCDETFGNAETCCTHLRYLNDKPFICTHCGKLFRFEEARDVHQEQPHVIPCSRCIVDVYFVSNSCLLLHCRQYHSSND